MKKTMCSLLVLAIVTTVQATIYSPPVNWDASLPNPNGDWTVYTQANGEGHTGAYTLSSYDPFMYGPGYGIQQVGLVACGSPSGNAAVITWPSAGAIVLAFTVPSSGTASITGKITGAYNSENAWVFPSVYRLNAAGTTAEELGTYSFNGQVDKYIDLSNISVQAGDRIMLGFSSAYNYAYVNLTGYAITVVPEPITIMLLAGGLVGLLRRR